MSEKAAGTIQVEDRVDQVFMKVCQALEVKIEMIIPKEGEKLKPAFDLNDALSKYVALMVYCGIAFHPGSLPSYHRVHADVEFWKKHFQEESPEKTESSPA